MSGDPTGIKITLDPTVQRMTGFTNHGFIPFDVPFISEIAPGLWQGGCKNGLMLPRFIKHVVSLYPWESYKVRHELASTLTVRLLDSEDQDTGMIDEIARWVIRCKSTGTTLVNCQAGLNRSSLVVARVLMLEGATADEAVQLVREKRSQACLCNPAFEKWLRDQEPPTPYADECAKVYAPRVTEDANDLFAANLARLRKEQRLTQGKLAEISGVSSHSISNAERRKNGVSLHTADALATALGTTVDGMTGGQR